MPRTRFRPSGNCGSESDAEPQVSWFHYFVPLLRLFINVGVYSEPISSLRLRFSVPSLNRVSPSSEVLYLDALFLACLCSALCTALSYYLCFVTEQTIRTTRYWEIDRLATQASHT